MSKRDELIAIYAGDLKEKCGVTPDMDLLTKVTIGLGPAIYNPDSSVVSGTQDSEIETIRANFLIRKLGLKDGPELKGGIGSESGPLFKSPQPATKGESGEDTER